MNLKAIFTTILVVCSITLTNAQSKDILAKSAMLNADEAYANGQYSECLGFLKDAETNLGATNSRIQYLKVKSLMAKGIKDQYNKTIWSQAEAELKIFFEVTTENGYVPEKYDEMIMAVSKVKTYFSIAESYDGKDISEINKWNNAIVKDPTNSIAYLYRGLAKFQLKDYQGAIQDYSKCIELDPNNKDAYRCRAFAMEELKDYQSAIQDYSKLIEHDPNDQAAYLYLRADAKENLKDYQGAIQDYNKMIELEPTNKGYYVMRARAKNHLKDYQGAVQDYSKAIEIDEKSTSYIYERGRTYQIHLNDVEAAKKDFEKVISINDNDRLVEIAFSNYYLGDKEKAFNLLNTILKDAGASKEKKNSSYLNLACLYSIDGNQPEAINALKNAFETGYNYFDNIENEEDFDNIRNSPEFKELINKYKNK